MPAKPVAETVAITVDGREIEARKGELLIAAAERAGIYIPRFCWHPRMKEVGMCRMCVVDVKGPRGWGLQPACYVPVNDGMEAMTTSPRVKKAQDGILEFLLINHPLDCPVCDKGGECPLQDHTMAFGPGESRMVEEKRHFEKPIPISDLVLLDRERCILCARCTRFAEEVAGDPFIQIIDRGNGSQINTFPDRPFASYFSGNTVQICPVGALTSADYRFRARPWDLDQVESTCTTCSVGCRVAIQSSANVITRLLGLDSDPVNHGWLCDKGRYSYAAVNSPDRLTSPLVRRDGELVEVSWGEALDAAAAGLARARDMHGPGAIAVLGGARLANEDAYAWARLAKGVLGTDNVDCQMADGLPAELVLSLPRATIDDVVWADTVVLVAPDLKEELPVLYLRLRDAVLEHGVKVLEISPRASGNTEIAAASLLHRPGEAMSVVSALLAASDPAESVAGVAKEDLAAARTLLGGDRSIAVVLGRPSLAESADATVAAAVALRDGLPQARFLPALRRSNVHGALDMGLAPGILPGRVSLDAGRSWFAEAWGQVPAERGLDAAGICAAAAEGRIHALVLVGADPAADLPDRELARRALAGAGFVVAVDAFRTASLEQADVVLPAAIWGERGGSTTNIEGRVSRLGQKVVPPGVSWPDWVIANELAATLGSDMHFASLAGILTEVEHLACSHAGLTPAVLSERRNRDGVVVPLGSAEPPGVPRPLEPTVESAVTAVTAHLGPGDETLTGGAEGSDDAAAEAQATPSPEGVDRPATLEPCAAPAVPAPKVDAYKLRLVTSRVLYDGGTIVSHAPLLAPLGRAGAALHVNPGDLNRFSLADGSNVRVSSGRASLTMPATADPGVPKGACWIAWSTASPGPTELVDLAAAVNDLSVESA